MEFQKLVLVTIHGLSALMNKKQKDIKKLNKIFAHKIRGT